jgi:hypothetical protein
MGSTGEWVRVEVDEDGRVCDVVLDPRVTSLSVDELRELLISALASPVPSSSSSLSVASVASVASADQLAEVSRAATEVAERRFAEISTALFDLSRAARRW